MKMPAMPCAVNPKQPWVLIAAFNEQNRLGSTLQKLRKAGLKNVIVVDDGSRDATAEEARQSAAFLLQHPVNCGKGAALQTGFDFILRMEAAGQCSSGVVITMDADGQHDPLQMSAVLQPVVDGRTDVVIGSRFIGSVQGLPLHRWLVLKLAMLFTRVFSGIWLSDSHNGYRALSLESVKKVRLQQPRFAYASELVEKALRQGLRVAEAPVSVVYTPETLAKGQRSWGALRISTDLLAARVVGDSAA